MRAYGTIKGGRLNATIYLPDPTKADPNKALQNYIAPFNVAVPLLFDLVDGHVDGVSDCGINVDDESLLVATEENRTTVRRRHDPLYVDFS